MWSKNVCYEASKFDMRFKLFQEVVLSIYEHHHILKGEFECWADSALGKVLGHNQVIIFVNLVLFWIWSYVIVRLVSFFFVFLVTLGSSFYMIWLPVLGLLVSRPAFTLLLDNICLDFGFLIGNIFSLGLLLECHL